MGAKLREPKSGVFWISRETEVVTAKSENRKRFELDCSIPIRDYQKQWFQGLRDRANSGQPFLIVEALTPHEIFEAFEIPFVTNEWWSGIVAYNRQSGYYFDVMEAAGYSRRLEYYPALSLAGAVDNGANPEPAWGGLPQPSLMVYGTSDGPRVELSERIAAVHGIPSFALSVPDTGLPMPARWWETSQRGWEQLSPTWQLDYVSQRYWALIRELEVLADRRLNMDRLREVVDLANHQQQMFDEIRAIIATSLATPIAMPELLGNLLTLQWQRGTSWAAAQATRMRDEIKARADAGHAVCAEERYRLGRVGAGMWQNTGFYRMFEESHGAVFVQNMYLSIAADGYRRFGPDLVRALASRYCAFGLFAKDWPAREAQLARCDGVVTVRDSLDSMVRKAFERVNIPVLALDIDLVDGRTWDEEAVRLAMDRFIAEELEPRRQARG